MFHPALFKGMNVVVTGGGRGIGLEVARQFLDCGARVFVHAGRSVGELPDFLETAATEGRAHVAAADFLADGGVEALAEAIRSRFDSVDILVNNAGTMVGRFPAAELTDEQYRHRRSAQPDLGGRDDTRHVAASSQRHASGDRQHRVDFGADRRQRRLLDLFGNQGVRLHLFQGAGARTGPGRHKGQLRFARHHHDRVSRALLVAGETGGKRARQSRSAGSEPPKTARRPISSSPPMRLPATSRAKCWRSTAAS